MPRETNKEKLATGMQEREAQVEVLRSELVKAVEPAPERHVSDVLGKGQFYPELPRVPFANLAGSTLKLVDAAIIEDFETQYGVHDLALMVIQDKETGKQFSTAASGVVIVKKIKKLIAAKVFPILATFSKDGKYWDIN